MGKNSSNASNERKMTLKLSGSINKTLNERKAKQQFAYSYSFLPEFFLLFGFFIDKMSFFIKIESFASAGEDKLRTEYKSYPKSNVDNA